ncbi:MAG: hypothetical protein AB1403_24040 [Candidatus Riflebacteria bacterium]
MLTFLRKNWIHLAAWTGMLFYLAFANDLYVHFFLKYGKPVLVNSQLPAESDQIKGHVDLFEPIVYEGQKMYSLVGWAFSIADLTIRPEDYDRRLVLISATNNYHFPMEAYSRPDVHAAFQSLGMELTMSGYHANVSQEAIAPGIYQVGFVFHNIQDGSIYHSRINKYLICTPNRLQISDTPALPAGE